MATIDPPTAAGAPPATDPPVGETGRPAVGVLLVHGIGQQRRADTLVEFGEPLVDWIDSWLKGASDPLLRDGLTAGAVDAWIERAEPGWRHGPAECYSRALEAAQSLRARAADRGDGARGSALLDEADRVVAGGVSLSDAALHVGEEVADPAHLTLHLTALRGSGEARHVSWILAESWWAQTFAAPRFSSIAMWAFDVVPCTTATHFGSQLRRAWTRPRFGPLRGLGRVAETGLAAASYLLGVVFGMGVGATMVLFSPLAAIPIPQVQNLFRGISRLLASTLGDSYVLVASPFQAASIVGRVRDDLLWLSRRCDTVVVVAHSQGGAVAFEALRQGVPDNVRRLITFGSGLRKLEELRMTLGGQQYFRHAGLASFSGMTLVLATALFPALFAPWGTWLWVAGGVLLAAGIAMSLERFDLEGIRRWGERFCPKRFVWEDYYADADPVPNGPLFDAEEDARFVLSSEVHNRASVIHDHNDYWRNREQFVSRIAHAASAGTAIPLARVTPDDPRLLGQARLRRFWRVRMLFAARGLIGLATGALALFQSDVARLVVRDYPDPLAPIRTLTKSFPWLHSRLTVAPEAMDVGWDRFLVVAVAGLLYVGLVAPLWRLWDARDGDRLARREKVRGVQWVKGGFIVSAVLVVELYGLLAILGAEGLHQRVLPNWITIAGTAAAALVGTYALSMLWWRGLDRMSATAEPPRADQSRGGFRSAGP